MKLSCPNCRRPIPSDDIDLTAGWAKCRKCDNEIIYTKGSCRLLCNSEAERYWLTGQINDFLQTVPYRPRPSDGREMRDTGN